MAKKYTKLVPEGQGGSIPDRDFYYLGGEIWASNASLPALQVSYREKGSTTSATYVTISPQQASGSHASFNYFTKIPKGKEMRLYFTPSTTDVSTFEYFRSEKLNVNITSVTANTTVYTDWVELTEDVFDIEMHSYKEMTGGGAG